MISPAWAGMRCAPWGTPGDLEPLFLPFLLGDSCVWDPIGHGPRESGILSVASCEARRGVTWTEARLVDNAMRFVKIRRMDYVIGMCGASKKES